MLNIMDRDERRRFEGVFSLLLTPFGEDGRIDWLVYDRYVDWQLAQSPNGLFAVCGSSEMKWLISIRMGARGMMAVVSAAAAGLVVAFWEQAQHNASAAAALHRQLVYLDSILRLGYPASAKYLASLQGIPMNTRTRWPSEFKAEYAKAVALWHEAYIR